MVRIIIFCITVLTFFVEKKKKKPKGYVISEFVWGYFDMLKIEDETGDFSY